MRSGFLALTLFFLLACNESVPEVLPSDIIGEEHFTKIMVDVQLIEGMKIHKLGPQRAKSPDMEAMYSQIFNRHDITQEDFHKTYDYYKSKPNQMELIYEAVLDSLSKLDVEVKKIYNTPKNRSETQYLDSTKKTTITTKNLSLIKSEEDLAKKDTTRND
ncbi:MAG: DUF4296 domain-containing protein [Bacteroidota bacterium]